MWSSKLESVLEYRRGSVLQQRWGVHARVQMGGPGVLRAGSVDMALSVNRILHGKETAFVLIDQCSSCGRDSRCGLIPTGAF